MTATEIIRQLNKQSNPANLAGMARYGIDTRRALGVSMPAMRNLAKRLGKNHDLACDLWNTRVHEAWILAGLIDDPAQVSERQMERWVKDFASWDVCDQVCSNLFDKTPFAYRKVDEWSRRKETFVKRAGFVLMAALSVHDKKAADTVFVKMLPIIKRESIDERNFVKKAVNWALRQIGKRNISLNKKAVQTAQAIKRIDSKSARWIAADALRELTSAAVQRRLTRT